MACACQFLECTIFSSPRNAVLYSCFLPRCYLFFYCRLLKSFFLNSIGSIDPLVVQSDMLRRCLQYVTTWEWWMLNKYTQHQAYNIQHAPWIAVHRIGNSYLHWIFMFECCCWQWTKFSLNDKFSRLFGQHSTFNNIDEKPSNNK